MGRRGRNRPPVADAGSGRTRRLRFGSETPGTITKGPPITVTCECGARKELFYGERWTCPDCGRSYDTSHIPADEYQAIRRLQLRYRALPVALGADRRAARDRLHAHRQRRRRVLHHAGGDHHLVRLPPADAPQALPRGDRRPPALGPARRLTRRPQAGTAQTGVGARSTRRRARGGASSSSGVAGTSSRQRIGCLSCTTWRKMYSARATISTSRPQRVLSQP